jgi:hypothetical protein
VIIPVGAHIVAPTDHHLILTSLSLAVGLQRKKYSVEELTADGQLGRSYLKKETEHCEEKGTWLMTMCALCVW